MNLVENDMKHACLSELPTPLINMSYTGTTDYRVQSIKWSKCVFMPKIFIKPYHACFL